MTKVKAVSKFIHGAYIMERGQESDIPESIANDLLGAGLVTIVAEQKSAPELDNKMAKSTPNKQK